MKKNSLKNSSFNNIVESTKQIVLSAIQKNIMPTFVDSIDDIVQETYLRAYKALMKNQFKGNSKLTTWLYQIARNETLRTNQKLLKEERKIEKMKMNLINNKNNLSQPQNKFNFDINILKDSINNLSTKYQQPLRLLLDGHKQHEISKILKINLNTVKSLISRGKKKLATIFLQTGA